MIFVSAAAIAVVVNAAITVVANRRKNRCPKSTRYNFELYLLSNIYLNEVKKKCKKWKLLRCSACLFASLFSIIIISFSTAFIRVYHFTFIHLPTLNARRLSIQCHIIFKVQSNMEFFLHLIDESLSME